MSQAERSQAVLKFIPGFLFIVFLLLDLGPLVGLQNSWSEALGKAPEWKWGWAHCVSLEVFCDESPGRKEVEEHLGIWQKFVYNPSFFYKKGFPQLILGPCLQVLSPGSATDTGTKQLLPFPSLRTSIAFLSSGLYWKTCIAKPCSLFFFCSEIKCCVAASRNLAVRHDADWKPGPQCCAGLIAKWRQAPDKNVSSMTCTRCRDAYSFKWSKILINRSGFDCVGCSC